MGLCRKCKSMSGIGEFHGEKVFGLGIFLIAGMPGKRERREFYIDS